MNTNIFYTHFQFTLKENSTGLTLTKRFSKLEVYKSAASLSKAITSSFGMLSSNVLQSDKENNRFHVNYSLVKEKLKEWDDEEISTLIFTACSVGDSTLLRIILDAGYKIPKKRDKQSVFEVALRNSFECFEMLFEYCNENVEKEVLDSIGREEEMLEDSKGNAIFQAATEGYPSVWASLMNINYFKYLSQFNNEKDEIEEEIPERLSNINSILSIEDTKLIKKLDAGAFGEVWKAVQYGKPFALKILQV